MKKQVKHAAGSSGSKAMVVDIFCTVSRGDFRRKSFSMKEIANQK